MESSALYSVLSGQVILLGIAMTRLTMAFIVLPLFSSQLIPPLIRNSIFVSLTLVTLAAQRPLDPNLMVSTGLLRLFAAEAFVGVALGIFFGLFIWAFEAAGEVVDTAIGSSMAMIFDPVSGNEVTLIGEFLGRLVNYLFMASGGLLLITGVVFKSYALWPLGQPLPEIDAQSVELFEHQFSQFLALTLMIASPLLVIIFLIDMSMGLVNRFAQQLNVLFLSISIKALASLLVLILMLPMLIQLFIKRLMTQSDTALDYLEAVLPLAL